LSAPVKLEDLIQSVRRRANIENQNAFITDSELADYINAGLVEVYDLLVEARAQDYYRSQYSFSTVGNQASYPIGQLDMYELISVDINLGNNITLSARPFMESERNRFKWYPGWFYSMPVYYRLQGSNLAFIPAPSAAYSVTLNYYPTMKKLSDPSDSFDGINGWEEYAIWHAVATCKAKADEDPSFALARMAELKEKIAGLAADRANYDADRVHDVFADYGMFGLGGDSGS
jgi:hypothetical protein